jgi:cysteinyl-tRNA synthetase
MVCRSKSLGNFFTIRDVLKKYHGMAMRWFLVNTQYRQPMNYSQVALEEASARLYYLTETLAASRKLIEASGTVLQSISATMSNYALQISKNCSCTR